MLDKISRDKAAGEEEDVPTKTVSAIEEIAFGDSHDDMDATTANGTAVDLLAGDNPAPAAIATPVSTPAAADALVEIASVVESSSAVAAEAEDETNEQEATTDAAEGSRVASAVAAHPVLWHLFRLRCAAGADVAVRSSAAYAGSVLGLSGSQRVSSTYLHSTHSGKATDPVFVRRF